VVTSISAGENNTFRFKDFEGEAEKDFTPLSFSESGDITAPVILQDMDLISKPTVFHGTTIAG
jgi:hypothetical protein